MARICNAAGSAWWEELEPFSLTKKHFSFQQSTSGTQSFDLWTFLFQYDWYTKKTTVVVDVVNRSAEGEEYLLLTLWRHCFTWCILNLCLLVWFGRWIYRYLQLSVVSPVLVRWQSAYHSLFSSAEPQSTAYSLPSFIKVYSQNTWVIVYGLVASSVGSVNGGYKYRKCHKSDFKWVMLAFVISWSFNATFGIQSVMMFFRVWSRYLVSAEHGEGSDGGQLLLSQLSPKAGRLFYHGLNIWSGSWSESEWFAVICWTCEFHSFLMSFVWSNAVWFDV